MLFRSRDLPYGQHLVEDDDVEAVVEVLRGDWLTSGPRVIEFEDALTRATGAGYATAVSSGAGALRRECSTRLRGNTVPMHGGGQGAGGEQWKAKHSGKWPVACRGRWVSRIPLPVWSMPSRG